MKFIKLSIVSFLLVFSPFISFANNEKDNFSGLYQTIDDETNEPKSIVFIYKYKDSEKEKFAGRIVALYDKDGKISETIKKPIKKASKLTGNPYLVGLDIIWNMEEKDNELVGGKILNPKNGKIYNSVIWKDEDYKLNVRGKIGPFGKTQIWNTKISNIPTCLKKLKSIDFKPIILE